jgi:hypothetical protein
VGNDARVTRYERRYRSVARTLGHLELGRVSWDDALDLSERELLDKNAGRRFLDYYGDEGIRLGLERYGIVEALARKGFVDLEIEMRATDERHTMIVTGRHASTAEVRHRLVELVVRRDRLLPRAIAGLEGLPRDAYDVLTVDWLMLQSPVARFTKDRPRLPGQDAPGLGIGERVLELLYRVAERLELQALVAVAEHFHNATLYARELPFFDPASGGRLRALEALLLEKEGLSLAQASWAVEWGLVRGADDAAIVWKGDAQVRAFDPGLAAWLASDAHLEAEARAAQAAKLVLDRSWLDEKWAAERAALEGDA